MTRKAKLEALLAKVEAETFDRWSTSSTPFTSPQKFFIQRAYDGSLDAAKALHEAVLPGWTTAIAQNMHHKHWNAYVTFINEEGAAIDRSGYSKTNPARAWLIAIIKALISMEATQ